MSDTRELPPELQKLVENFAFHHVMGLPLDSRKVTLDFARACYAAGQRDGWRAGAEATAKYLGWKVGDSPEQTDLPEPPDG